jgi:predicted secreted protein
VLAKRYGARPVAGKGHGQSDDVHATIDGQQPARVARDEAVLDAAQVKKAGGAKKLYAMMERVRKQATGSPKQMRAIDANKALR